MDGGSDLNLLAQIISQVDADQPLNARVVEWIYFRENSSTDIGACPCGARFQDQHETDCERSTLMTRRDWIEEFHRRENEPRVGFK